MKYLFRKTTIFTILLATIAVFTVTPVSTVKADSLDDLQRQKDELSNKIDASQQAADQKEQEALTLEGQISTLESNIASTEAQITQTTNEITQVRTEISTVEGEISETEEELNKQLDNFNQAVVELYRAGRKSNVEKILGSKDLADAVQETTYLDSLQEHVNGIVGEITETKNNLEGQKTSLEDKNANLQALSNQQISQKESAIAQRSSKDSLLAMTQSEQQEYLDSIEGYQDQIDEIVARMNVLRGTRNWGTQIISGSVSWYYTQTGNYTRLGPSPYTVNDYGCLITSVAMIATYYGNYITPTDIATTYGSFDYNGYLLGLSPQIGVSVGGSQSINWSTVDDQISSGHPVIISIYLPSVGPVNTDGSSHFVVIYGRSGDTYLMADPIGGGRGYDLNQVRSMKIVSH